MDLQEAKTKLAQAQKAMDSKDGKAAERAATQAQLSAELAVAKGQSAAARKANEELQASIQQLRDEASRNAVAPR